MNESEKLSSEQRDKAAAQKRAAYRIERRDREAAQMAAKAELRLMTDVTAAIAPLTRIFRELTEQCPGCSPDDLLAASLQLLTRYDDEAAKSEKLDTDIEVLDLNE